MARKKTSAEKVLGLLKKRVSIKKKGLTTGKKKVLHNKQKKVKLDPKKFVKRKEVIGNVLKPEKFKGNPMVAPQDHHSWESKATFNPAALYAQGKVHLLYRAIGENDISVLGYAASDDAYNIYERQTFPAYIPPGNSGFFADRYSLTHISPIQYASGGGGNGGCEDPRMVLIDGRVYMTYTAFDGWGSLRMAITSISISDFLKKKWNWKQPILISKPGEIHKNWVLFPEKIEGKFAILHCVCPDISVELFDDLDFQNKEYIESYYNGKKGKQERWDNWVRGAGPPPIKTKDGWLLIYHAMDRRDPNRYKMGAMLLDLKNPSNVLYRTNKPFLEPDERYENEGFKAGVSYCCGAIVKNGELFIYYGGADTVCCVASTNLDDFLSAMKKNIAPKLTQKRGVLTKAVKLKNKAKRS